MSPKNRKGVTLMEMMVVVIIIAGLVLAAYPTYLSSLEKARAQEAVQLISHLAAAQDKFMAECYSMNPSTGQCQYSTNFKTLPVEIAGPNYNNKDINNVSEDKITTPGYTYIMSGTGDALTITAAPRRTSYKYDITARVAGSEIFCNAGSEKSGIKICGAIGKKTTTEGVYKID